MWYRKKSVHIAMDGLSYSDGGDTQTVNEEEEGIKNKCSSHHLLAVSFSGLRKCSQRMQVGDPRKLRGGRDVRLPFDY